MALRWRLPRAERERVFTWPEVKGVFIADTRARCRQALEIVNALDIVGVDIEAYGFNPKKQHAKGKGRALSVQFAGDRGPMIFVPLWSVTKVNEDGTYEIDPQGKEYLLDEFSAFLEDPTPKKVLHGGKFDRHVLANHGVQLRGLLGDTHIMDYLAFNGEQLHGLKECMRRYFKERGAHDFKDVFKTPVLLKKPRKDKKTGELIFHGKRTYVPSLADVVKTDEGVEKLVEYAGKDPRFTVQLYRFLAKALKEMPWVRQDEVVLNYFDYYERIARPYGDVIYDMEREGCPVDYEHLKNIQERLDVDIAKTERRFMKACVRRGLKPSRMAKVNMNAGAQIASILYDELGIKCERLTEKNAKSTSKTALEAIVAKEGRSKRATRNAKLVKIIQLHRSQTTLRKMFVTKLVALAPQYGNKIHSNFKQAGTATGRLSSATPNLENIPTGKKDDVYMLRKAFIAPPGWAVCDIDLKQIEVRLMAHFTKDPVLIALLEGGWDQHLVAMCMLFPEVREFMGATYEGGVVTFLKDRPPDAKASAEGEEKFGKAQWGEWRRRGKILNFGVSYGMGPQGFANQLGGGATTEDGKIAITAYFKGFRGLQKGIRRIQKKCHRFGFVKTLLKRYCMIPGIHSGDYAIRGASERKAFNYVIQGSAADMLMLGMLLCWMDKRLRAWGVKMVNQIHDELVFLIRKKFVEKAKPIIEEYISHPYRHTKEIFGFAMNDLIVDTPADLGVGPNWMKAKK